MERNFETVMIEQCAPVLASLKPAGLFRYETSDCADLACRVRRVGYPSPHRFRISRNPPILAVSLRSRPGKSVTVIFSNPIFFSIGKNMPSPPFSKDAGSLPSAFRPFSAVFPPAEPPRPDSTGP